MITAPPVPTINNVVRHVADAAPRLKEAPLHHTIDSEPGLSFWSTPEVKWRDIHKGSTASDDTYLNIEKSLSSKELDAIDDFFNFEKDLEYPGLNMAHSGSSEDLTSGSWDDIWNKNDDESLFHAGDSLTDTKPQDGNLNIENNGVSSGTKRSAEQMNADSKPPRPTKKPRAKKAPVESISQGEIDYRFMQIQRSVQPMDRAGFESAMKHALPDNTDIFDANLNKILDMFATKPENIEGKIVNLPLVKDGTIMNAIKTLPDLQKQIVLAYAGSQARWRLSNQLLKSGISRIYLDHVMAIMRQFY